MAGELSSTRQLDPADREHSNAQLAIKEDRETERVATRARRGSVNIAASSSPSNVVRIQDFKARDTVDALEELLASARSGRISGLAFAIKYDGKEHAFGLTGDYLERPMDAAAMVIRVQHRLNQLIDKME